MADQTSTLKIGAEVEGAPSIKDLTAAYQQMTAGVQNFSSLLARVRPAAAAPDQPKSLGEKVIAAAGNLGMEGLRGAATVAGGAIKTAASSLLSFAGPLSNVAMASLATAPTAIAAGLALVAVVPFVFNLGVTYNLVRRSWKWANDSMQKQFDVANRTRRTFPGIIGDEFARITPYVKARMGMTSALFGEAAASMEDMITRRLTPERLMRGVRGEKDLFSSVGITPGFIAQMERMKGQSLNVGGRARLDLTDYLAIFIKKREALEAQILAAPEGSTLRQLLSHRKSQMLDKSLRVFNARFADLASFMTMEDLRKLGEQSRASTGLNVVTKESVKNAAEFRLAVGTTREIFYQLKMGIGREVQPVITRIMTDLSDWLLPIREDGQSMAMNLRNLGAALAIKGWEFMEALMRRINVGTVRKLGERLRQWRPEGSIKILMFLARELHYLADGLVRTLLAAAKALGYIKMGAEFQGLSAEEIVRRKRAGLPLVGPATPRLGPGGAGVPGIPGGGGFGGGGAGAGYGAPGAPGAAGGGYLGGGRGPGSPSGTGYLNDSGVGPGGDWTPSPESGAGSFRAGAQQRMNYFQMQGKGPYERSQLSTVKTPFGKVAAHPEAEQDVAGFFNELQTHGAPIKKLGSYNKRRMRRGSMWSSHGYGVAFDLDDAQYLSPEMKAWIKRNPDKWSAAKKRWNMSQMQSTESTGGTGGWDPGHVEWIGPAGKQAERAPGVAPGAVTVERAAPSPFGAVPTVTPEGTITYAPQAPQAVQPTAPGPVTTGGPFPAAILQTTDPGKKARVKNLEPLIQKAATEAGVDPNILRTFVSIESGGDPNRSAGSYKGLTALDQNQFTQFGGQGSIYDPYQNLKAGAKRLSTYNKDFKRRHGRDATDAELYFYHQQGPSGSEHHIKNPDQPAWQSFWNATGRSKKWPPERAKKAIYGNLTPAAQAYFRQKYGAGWEGKITSREFTDYWRQNYYNQGKFVGSYVGGGTPEGIATQEVQKDEAIPVQAAAPTTEMPRAEQAVLTTAPPQAIPASVVTGPVGEQIETASRVRQLQQTQARDRRLPITPQLQDVLNRAGAEAGLEVHVTSGGQRYIPGASGQTIKGVRTGSTRHDLRAGQLGAADVKFWDAQQRRYLDFRNPNDRPRMEKAVEASVAAGATGIGAGMGYMGGQTVHIGGGDVATWGREGKGGFVSRAHRRGRERRARGDIPAAAPTYQGVPQLTPTTVTATVPVSYTQSDLYQTLGEMTGLSPDVAQQLASTPQGHATLAKYMRDQQDEEDRINKRGKYAPVTPEDVANLKTLSDKLASGQLTAADLATPAVWKDADKISKEKERELFTDAVDRMNAKDREALRAREDLVKPAIDVQKPAIEEGTAAGKAATKAFKDGIKDVKIPVKSLTEEEKNRDKKTEEKEKEAEAA